jgi:hypothetical protein
LRSLALQRFIFAQSGWSFARKRSLKKSNVSRRWRQVGGPRRVACCLVTGSIAGARRSGDGLRRDATATGLVPF